LNIKQKGGRKELKSAGNSGVAMALDCSEGLITGVVEEDIIIEGQNCTINDAEVTGNIEVLNSEDITIVGTKVEGRVSVEKSRFATLVGNNANRIVVRNNELASVVANSARRIRVNQNLIAFVKQNASVTLVCRRNVRLDSFLNNAEEEDCR
jgi:hypothetical protein